MTAADDGGGDRSAVEAPAAEQEAYDGADALLDRRTDADGPKAEATTARTEVIDGPRFVIRNGNVEIVEDDLDEARGTIEALLARYGGLVSDEKTVSDDEGVARTSKLVVRVPVRNFDALMLGLKEATTVVASDTTSEDVGREVLDVEARLKNLRTSLGRLRSFLEDATDINALLDFERRITQVESEIASLVSQQAFLADQTSLSTVKIDLRTPEEKVAPTEKKDPLEGAGFLSGLKGGWNALVDIAVVAATGLGAATPFAGAALLLTPVWLLLRRRRRLVPAA